MITLLTLNLIVFAVLFWLARTKYRDVKWHNLNDFFQVALLCTGGVSLITFTAVCLKYLP